MEFLKDPLGEELYGQVAEKLAGSQLKLADLSAGMYVGKDKYEASIAVVAERDKQLAELRKMEPEKLQVEIARLQEQNQRDKEETERRMSAIQFDHALTEALFAEKAKNPKAVAALLDRSTLKFTDGKIKGLKEQLDNIRKDNGYLFSDEPTQKGGSDFPPPGTTPTMNSFLRG